MNLMPLLHEGVKSEIDASDRLQVPSLFLFDIQPEQKQELTALIQQNKQKIQAMMPMVMARLKEVDGKAPKKNWREGQVNLREQEVANNLDQGVRLTYQEKLNETEEIIAGDAFQPDHQGNGERNNPVPISLERRFASRIGATLGSRLLFSVQGIPIWATVLNLRDVKWNSFRPNFFIVFPLGTLEYAPQTYLASVSKMSDQESNALQDLIVDQFANISVIDVSQVVNTLMVLSERISIAISVIAIFAILAGLIVMFSIARSSIRQRMAEMNLLKVLGMQRLQLLGLFVSEYGLMASLASLIGISMSILISNSLSFYYFRIIWALNWSIPIGSFAIIAGLAMLIAFQSSYHLTGKRPWALLRTS